MISRGALARTVRLLASVDGAFVARYVADGLILATPTGSTAYAYAVGGPILPPWLENIVLIPAAPRSQPGHVRVLDAEAVVEVLVETEMEDALCGWAYGGRSFTGTSCASSAVRSKHVSCGCAAQRLLRHTGRTSDATQRRGT